MPSHEKDIHLPATEYGSGNLRVSWGQNPEPCQLRSKNATLYKHLKNVMQDILCRKISCFLECNFYIFTLLACNTDASILPC